MYPRVPATRAVRAGAATIRGTPEEGLDPGKGLEGGVRGTMSRIFSHARWRRREKSGAGGRDMGSWGWEEKGERED